MKNVIKVKKVNLMGYTPETQMWIVQNGGGPKVFAFLEAHRKHFLNLLAGAGFAQLGLQAHRVEKFKAYAESKGFEVEVGGYA